MNSEWREGVFAGSMCPVLVRRFAQFDFRRTKSMITIAVAFRWICLVVVYVNLALLLLFSSPHLVDRRLLFGYCSNCQELSFSAIDFVRIARHSHQNRALFCRCSLAARFAFVRREFLFIFSHVRSHLVYCVCSIVFFLSQTIGKSSVSLFASYQGAQYSQSQCLASA